jgi:preprotein translocase subunit SecE
VAESKGRGEDAVDERLDEALEDDALRDDDALDDDDADGDGATRTKSKPKKAGGVDKSTKSKAVERPGIFARIRNVVLVFVAIVVTIVGLLDLGFAKAVLFVFGTGK